MSADKIEISAEEMAAMPERLRGPYVVAPSLPPNPVPPLESARLSVVPTDSGRLSLPPVDIDSGRVDVASVAESVIHPSVSTSSGTEDSGPTVPSSSTEDVQMSDGTSGSNVAPELGVTSADKIASDSKSHDSDAESDLSDAPVTPPVKLIVLDEATPRASAPNPKSSKRTGPPGIRNLTKMEVVLNNRHPIPIDVDADTMSVAEVFHESRRIPNPYASIPDPNAVVNALNTAFESHKKELAATRNLPSIHVKRKHVPDGELSGMDSEGESERDEPVSQSDEGILRFKGSDRCAACIALPNPVCHVEAKGFRKLAMWATDVVENGSKTRRPAGSACMACSKRRANFCSLPVTDRILGPGYQHKIDAGQPPTHFPVSSTRKRARLATAEPVASTSVPIYIVWYIDCQYTHPRCMLADQRGCGPETFCAASVHLRGPPGPLSLSRIRPRSVGGACRIADADPLYARRESTLGP